MAKTNEGPPGPDPRGAQPRGTEAYPLVFQKPRLSLLARFKSWFGIAPRPSPKTVPSVEQEQAGGALDVEPKTEQPKIEQPKIEQPETEQPETEQPDPNREANRETNREPIPIAESRPPSISVVREPDEARASDDTPAGPVLRETDRDTVEKLNTWLRFWSRNSWSHQPCPPRFNVLGAL